jgi:hypothetical protein
MIGISQDLEDIRNIIAQGFGVPRSMLLEDPKKTRLAEFRLQQESYFKRFCADLDKSIKSINRYIKEKRKTLAWKNQLAWARIFLGI